jgi:NhaP-type Na+/H+ or K+/H+ antiporter
MYNYIQAGLSGILSLIVSGFIADLYYRKVFNVSFADWDAVKNIKPSIKQLCILFFFIGLGSTLLDNVIKPILFSILGF